MKLIQILALIGLCVGVVALLNWIGGEKHLLFNGLRKDWKKFEKLWKKQDFN